MTFWLERKLLEQIKIDPAGVRNELESAKRTNIKFWNEMYSIGKNLFFHKGSEEVFEVTEDGKDIRITRRLKQAEIDRINQECPPANE